MERLPDEVVTPRLVLRRWQLEDIPALREAVAASVDHLRPWMEWVKQEPLDDQERTRLMLTSQRE